MGQRLITNFCKSGEVFAALYQHWDGYTDDALCNLKKIIEYLKDRPINSKADLVHLLHDVFNAWLDPAEKEYLNDPEFTFVNFEPNRSNGLIGLSKEVIEELKYWGEEEMEIDLGFKTISFGVLWCYADWADLVYESRFTIEETEEAIKNFVTCEINKDCFSFDDADDFINKVLTASRIIYFPATEEYTIKVE